MRQKPLIVVTNRCFPETLALLRGAGEVDANDGPEPWPRDEIAARCREAAAIMAFMTDRVDAEFLKSCPRLRVIGAALKGYDNIDVDAASAAGVWVTIVPDLLTAPTAELAIGLMLGLGRRIVSADRGIRACGFHGWRPAMYGRGLAGETVGIVGFGRVGQAIAHRLAGFDCTILVCDTVRVALPPGLAGRVTMLPLTEVIGRSGYVVLALPLLASTQHLFDAAMIARMRRGAILVNPARGSLVDEAAVAEAIETGQLSGYAADVFECEDWARPDRPERIDGRLTREDSPTVLTPHIGSAVENVRREIELSAAHSIIEALSGRPPSHAVNRPATGRSHAQPAAYQDLPRGA